MTLDQAFVVAKRVNATLDKPVTFVTDVDIVPARGRIIPKGSEVRVFHGREMGFVLWKTPEGKKHITSVY